MSKKSEITEYFVFNREWYELKKTVSKKVWDELFDLMLQLRFDGVDTDPQTIKSKTVRSYWVMIRVRILSSMDRCERKKEERKRKMETNSEFQQDMQPNTEFDSEPENSPNKTVITAEYPSPQPKTESPSEGQESGKNEVLETVSSTNVDESVKIGADAVGETGEDDNGIGSWDIADTPSEQWFVFDDDVVEEYERKLKEKEDMIKQEVIDKFKDIRYNSPEYWRAMREVIDPLPSCDKDTAIREINQYFNAV